MLLKGKYFHVLFLSMVLFSHGGALYFEWHKGGQRYDSNSVENFERFYAKFLSVPENREVVEAMKRLPISHMGAVIDPYWTVGVRHVWDTQGITKTLDFLEEGMLIGNDHYILDYTSDDIKQRFPETTFDFIMLRFPGPSRGTLSLDDTIALSEQAGVDGDLDKLNKWLANNGIPENPLIRPIKRYYGTDLRNKEIYLTAIAVHNAQGGLVAHATMNPSRMRPTFTRCRLVVGQNPVTQQIVEMEIVNDNGLITRTYGGDSCCQLLIRVNHTGDPYEDFQLLGGNSVQNGNRLTAVLYSNPELSNKINQRIIKSALSKVD